MRIPTHRFEEIWPWKAVSTYDSGRAGRNKIYTVIFTCRWSSTGEDFRVNQGGLDFTNRLTDLVNLYKEYYPERLTKID